VLKAVVVSSYSSSSRIMGMKELAKLRGKRLHTNRITEIAGKSRVDPCFMKKVTKLQL
jgi:hypothetical protein